MASATNSSQTFILLQQEGFLFGSAIATGLTELRKASVQNKGAFYSSMFNLSIGMERLMKSLLIMDHMLVNNLQVPSQAQLRAYGHDLHALYDKCETLSRGQATKLMPRKSLEPSTASLLRLLNDFAKTARYHNLTSLSATQVGADPLEEWNELLVQLLQEDVPVKKRKAILAAGDAITRLLAGRTMVAMKGLDKRDLSLNDAISLPSLHAEAVRHAVVRLGLLISSLRDLLGDLSGKAYEIGTSIPPFPQMQEFLEWLPDDATMLQRKARWP